MALLAGAFLVAIWLPGMTVSLVGAGCRNPAKSYATRLRLCNTAIAVSRLMLTMTEPHKFAGTYMTRGIVLANLDQPDRASTDMKRALDMATAGRPRELLKLRQRPLSDPMRKASFSKTYWLDTLFDMVDRKPVSAKARALWDSSVSDAESG